MNDEKSASQSSKLSAELVDLMSQRDAVDDNTLVPVIITVDEGEAIEDLESTGLVVERKFDAISAVSGKIPMNAIMRLSEQGQVNKIELDGEITTLKN